MTTKINVLQVIPKLGYGGAETGCYDIAHYLAEQECGSFIATSGGDLLKFVKKNKVGIFKIPVHSKNPILIILNSLFLSFLILFKKINIVHARSRAPAWSCYLACILTNTILISSALYLFFITIRDFFIKKYKNISQNIAHFGFSLLILSILLNNLFSDEIITNLKVGETFENSKTKIVFESIDQKNEKNYSAIIANFSIRSSNGEEDSLSPELRIYNQPTIATSEADIRTNLLTDKFIVINLVQNQDYFNVRYQVKPFMLWIWLSVILISFGGIVSFLKKHHEK